MIKLKAYLTGTNANSTSDLFINVSHIMTIRSNSIVSFIQLSTGLEYEVLESPNEILGLIQIVK